MSEEFNQFIEQLESFGEEEANKKLQTHIWASDREKWAQSWLSSKSSERRDAREEAMLAISVRSTAASERSACAAEEALEAAKSANNIARRANNHALAAWIAAAVAAIAAIIAAI